eukprot:TRINITY_DN2665_c0_g1_i1.p1 TRINITY_DN2665_c0_g1~~TRINITY_DN2665_c0_g1_i1.p1  ORF type:complete len:197 (+),score=17.37 TRINITY_DN2665_c0_g1_i1:70-660(+)
MSEEQAIVDGSFDPTKKKRRQKTKKVDAGSTKICGESTYDYAVLLSRAQEKLNELKNQSVPKARAKAPTASVPVISTGPTKTQWNNFSVFVASINRPIEHVQKFVSIELATSVNLDSNGALIVVGRFQAKQFAAIQKKYLQEFVICGSCKRRDTIYGKEDRLHFVRCTSPLCGVKHSVPALKKGYVHIINRQDTRR